MPPRAAAARAAYQRARGLAVWSRCLSPVGVYERAYIGFAGVAQREIDRLALVVRRPNVRGLDAGLANHVGADLQSAALHREMATIPAPTRSSLSACISRS